MRRLTLILSTTLLAAIGAASPAAGQAGAPRTGLSAKLTACTTGAEPAARAATFTASMPAGAGARRMAIRFELRQSLGRGGFTRVDVPGWDEWERSRPGRSGFIFTKRVQDLAAPAAYRAVVRFRWYDRRGRVVRRARRTTAVCRQPDPRPQLLIASLGRARGEDSLYEVVVRNAGGSAASAFRVALTVDGIEYSANAGPLASGSRERVRVRAPRCEPGSVVTVAIDADNGVDEGREDDNVLRRPCPVRA